MNLEQLDAKNPIYDAYEHVWKECHALYSGGEHFKSMLDHFLPSNPKEPMDVYASRKKESAYISYVGPIVDYFVSWLYSGQFSMSARKANTPAVLPVEAYYSEFEADIGGDVNLNDFMRDRTTEALVNQCAHWVLEFPALSPDESERFASGEMDRHEYQARKFDRAVLKPVQRLQMYDWECDHLGKLTWCIIHDLQYVRPDPRAAEARNMVRETWKLYTKTDVEVFQLIYEKGKRPVDLKTLVPSLGKALHRFKELPLVSLHVKDGLWIADRVRAAQVEHFRADTAKNWLIRRTCYAMPIVFLENPETDIGIMGSGYYLTLGQNDKFEWTAPPNTPFDVLQKSIDSKRDEIFRIVHQMAQGLDNNADTVGRSADSKQIDTAATRIMLNAYGAVVRKAIEETMEILSDANGDVDVYWAVEGFNGYDTATVGELVANSIAIRELTIPSRTLRRELDTKVGLAAIADADPTVRNAVRKEIREGVDAMSDMESTHLPAELQVKLDQQRMKNEATLKVQDKKSADVRTTAKMNAAAKKSAPQGSKARK